MGVLTHFILPETSKMFVASTEYMTTSVFQPQCLPWDRAPVRLSGPDLHPPPLGTGTAETGPCPRVSELTTQAPLGPSVSTPPHTYKHLYYKPTSIIAHV